MYNSNLGSPNNPRDPKRMPNGMFPTNIWMVAVRQGTGQHLRGCPHNQQNATAVHADLRGDVWQGKWCWHQLRAYTRWSPSRGAWQTGFWCKPHRISTCLTTVCKHVRWEYQQDKRTTKQKHDLRVQVLPVSRGGMKHQDHNGRQLQISIQIKQSTWPSSAKCLKFWTQMPPE